MDPYVMCAAINFYASFIANFDCHMVRMDAAQNLIYPVIAIDAESKISDAINRDFVVQILISHNSTADFSILSGCVCVCSKWIFSLHRK